MTEVKPSFRDLKVGDRVERWIHTSFFMEMEVIQVDDTVIYCDHIENNKRKGFTPSTCWQFDRDIGCEEDHALHWGKNFGVTGSYLKRKVISNDGLSDQDSKEPIVS